MSITSFFFCVWFLVGMTSLSCRWHAKSNPARLQHLTANCLSQNDFQAQMTARAHSSCKVCHIANNLFRGSGLSCIATRRDNSRWNEMHPWKQCLGEMPPLLANQNAAVIQQHAWLAARSLARWQRANCEKAPAAAPAQWARRFHCSSLKIQTHLDALCPSCNIHE